MITTDQIAAYESQGAVIVEGVLKPTVVERLRKITDGWVDDSRALTDSNEMFSLEPTHSASEPRIRRVKNPCERSAAFAEVMGSAEVLDCVEALIGPNIRYQAGKLNMKSSGGGAAIEWHQDFAFYPHTNTSVLAVGIPLDDSDERNGCLMVVEASHRGPILSHERDGRFVGAVDPAALPNSRVAPLVCRAGDLSIHHGHTLHASAPNRSGRDRRLLLLEYVAGDAFPIVGADYDELARHIVRGRQEPVARVEAMEVRLPVVLPTTESRDVAIFELQEASGRSSFQ